MKEILFNDLMNSHDEYTLIGLSEFCRLVMSIFNAK